MNPEGFTKGHALVVGVGADLSCTVDDAKGLAAILLDRERCAFPSAQLHLLTGEGAGRAAILAALKDLAETTNSSSDLAATVIIYFSGHGYRHGGRYFLIPNGCNLANLDEQAITGAEFAAAIAAIPAARKLILLDCCHAGGVGEAKGFGLSKAPLPDEALELFRQGSGYVLIASSTEDEVSYTGKPYSVFTGSLIEAFCGQGVAKKDGFVRVADLIGHCRERVPQLTKNKQHPVLHFEQADNFVVAYYAGGDPTAKALPFVLQSDAGTDDALAGQVSTIQAMFGRARYQRAYDEFYHLCDNYPDYQIEAAMLRSRYGDYENQVIAGTLSASQQQQTRMEIAAAFQACLQRFKQDYLNGD
jgi:hypothetical protein